MIWGRLTLLSRFALPLKLLRYRIAFAWREKEIRFKAMLARVQIVVATAESEEFRMVAAFDNPPLFDHQNLVGTANGGEPVGDDEGLSLIHI